MKRLLVLLLLSLIIAGCSRSKPSQFYLLNPLPFTLKKSLTYDFLQIGVDPVKIPAYLEKPQLTVFYESHVVSLDESHQWAEALDKNIERVIITNLSSLLPGSIVQGSLWDIKFKPKYHLQIVVAQFSMSSEGDCILRAEYIMYYHDDIIKKREVYYHSKAPKAIPAELVKAMNSNLNHLSKEIAKSFAELKPA